MNTIQLVSASAVLGGLLHLVYRLGRAKGRDDGLIARLRVEFRAMRELIGHIFERVDRIERHLHMVPA